MKPLCLHMEFFTLNFEENVFNDLLVSANFESTSNGRLGTTLVSKEKNIPLVRTTTKYFNSVQYFSPLHYNILDKIKEKNCLVESNNALIEVYNNDYTKMGFHSDQALDLKEDSRIAIFSCYNNGNGTKNVRKLIIKNKQTDIESEITMSHNSVICFDTEFNKKFLHKIVLQNCNDNCNNDMWLGITFRLSKTFLSFINGIPFLNNKVLKLANEDQKKNFYKLRSQENKSTNFSYPEGIDFTISPSDLVMPEEENKMLLNNYLVVDPDIETPLEENFCGKVVYDIKEVTKGFCYFCGDCKNLKNDKIVFVVKEYSTNYENKKICLITEDQVPTNYKNIGIFVKNFFGKKDYFNKIETAHKFQQLTESNKPTKSYRTGIYLSNVVESNFNLMRCSTNFDGPTEKFKQIDHEILARLDWLSEHFFEQKAYFNHVLAQIYNNYKINGKDKKAKISEHSDKTKDMPKNGLIAFCTFYKNEENETDINKLCKLVFKNKKTGEKHDIILYPNSVFVITLETNRLFTHEIKAPIYDVSRIPLRMGYVVRCSDTIARFDESDQIYIDDKKMTPASEKDTEILKFYYRQENKTTEQIYYPKFTFSLNEGDYTKPIF